MLSIGTRTIAECLLVCFLGIIYAFNVQTSGDVQNLAKERKVEIRNFNIIYRLVEDLKAQLNAQLPMVDTEEVLGK